MRQREAYPSVDAMVEPSVLGGLLARPVSSVVLAPMETKGWSTTESGFEAVLVDGETTPAAVVKRIRWSADWHAIATDDAHGRELAMWESGILDRLPVDVGHGVLAVARFDDGAALLMEDLHDHFLREDADVTLHRATGVLRSIASMHALFWENPPTSDLGDATARLERMIARLSPTTLGGLQDVLPDNELVVTFPEGWDRLPKLVDPGVARDLQALADDPSPIMAALARFPVTLLHGDLWIANVAWDRRRAIPVDWQPTVAPPGFDCAYFVWSLGNHSSFHPDEAWVAYLDRLRQAVDPDTPWTWWDEHLDISIAAVTAMMASPSALYFKGNDDPDGHPPWASYRWWVERAAPGLRLIDRA